MKPIFSKTTDKFLLVAKLSDDRIKLFLDVDPIPEKEEAPQVSTTPAPDAQAQGNSGEITPPMALPPQIKYKTVIRDDLIAALSELIKAELLNTGVLDDIAEHLSSGEKIEERRVAKGEEPQTGADGKLLFLVKRFTGIGEVTISDKGFADFRQLKIFDNITKGTLVARIYPPKNGIDGKDALGQAIPAQPGKPAKVSVDRTLTIRNPEKSDEPYQVVAAEAEGYLLDENGNLSIHDELIVKGNLDYHLGALDFIGRVIVRGDVLPGFAIKARNGILIDGSVREANLVCTNGDIVVRGHIYGGDSAEIVCAKNFEFVVAQELEAEVIGNITIAKEALDCSLRSHSSIFGDRASIVGGRALSVCGSQVACYGNEAGKETFITLCSDVELSVEFTQLNHNIESHEKASKLIDLHLGPLAIHPERIERLGGAHREKMKKLLEKKVEIEASREKLLEKKRTMLETAHSNKVVRVNILESMFEGVHVSVGTETFSPPERIAGPASLDYIAEEKAFKVGELKALECSVPGSVPTPDPNQGRKR